MFVIPMDVLIKVLSRCIVGVFMLGLLGCGCLFPSTPSTLQNLYVDLYSDADHLSYLGEYRAALEKYERAFKLRPRFTNVIDVSYLALFKYRMAYCYAKLAEVEGDDSLYVKAEEAIRESYQTAMLLSDQAYILYLWGYILYKQGRYEAASAKFEALTLPPHWLRIPVRVRLLWDGLYGLGRSYLELGDEAAARQTFRQLEVRIKAFLHDGGWRPSVGDEILYGLGKGYLELGDKAAAQEIFTMREALIYTDLEEKHPHVGEEILFAFGKAYYELGDEVAARKALQQLEELINTYPHPWYPYVRKEVLYGLGIGYLELGDEAAARRVFAKVETLIETYLENGWPFVGIEILYGLGKAYLELEDEAAARKAFRQLLKEYPNTSYKSEVKRLLKNM